MKRDLKDIRQNVAVRRAILTRCQQDEKFQEQIWIKCSRSFVYWVDLFVWTLASKTRSKFPKVPFILYPFQERAALDLIKAIGKEDRLVEKSRDMGATWLILLVFTWLFIFRKDQSFLVGSRKQEYVDLRGSPKTLFYKIDFILDKLPPWMRPAVVRTNNHIENLENGSIIDGESTNENFGAGDRRAAVLLDEFALSEYGYSILGAVGDVTDCCIYNSTPMGASGAYYDTRQQMARDAPHRILRFHWSDHPIKRRGLYKSEKDDSGVFHLKVLDEEYHAANPNYKFILDGKLRSVAYDVRDGKAANKQIIAQQWDIDYLKSGWQFFDAQKLEAILTNKSIVRPPTVRGEIIRDPDWKNPKFIEQSGGRLQLWFPMPADGKIPWDDIVIGCDIASGSGGEMSSNSSASIARKSTGEKIGELTDNNIYPNDFATYVLSLASFFNDAFIIWERNGPNGAQFGKVIKDSGYRKIFFPKKESRLDFVESKEPGWWTSDDTKAMLLGKYAEALWSGAFSNPSELALIECGQYVQNGKKIEHSRSLANATTDPTAVGEAHGDRCFVAGTMVRTIYGEVPIEQVKVGDWMVTRRGPRRVLAAAKTSDAAGVCEVRLSNGRTLTGTPSHPVWTDNRGWVSLSLLTPSDILNIWPGYTKHSPKQKQSSLTESGFIGDRIPNTNTCGDTSGRTPDTRRRALVRCIGKCGNSITEKFQKACRFITKTRTHLTTTSTISHVSRLRSMVALTKTVSISLPVAARFCTNTPASSVALNTKLSGNIGLNTAAKPAKRLIGERTNSTTKTAPVFTAVENFSPTHTDVLKSAHTPAERVSVRSVVPLQRLAPVYNLSVEGQPEYYAEGVLVHNCIADALAYWGIQDRGAGPGKPPEVDTLPVNSAAYRFRQRQSRGSDDFDWR